MFSKRTWGLAAPLAAVAATLIVASPASAATQSFGCRASVARVSLLNNAVVPAVEPFVANPNSSPCATDSAGLSTGNVLDLSGLNLGGLLGPLTNALGGNITLGAVSANTNAVATDSSMSASALTSVSGVNIPTPAGAISIVGPAQATASYQCVNGAVQAVAGSTLSVITIAGKSIALPPNGGPMTIPLSVPGLLGLLPATTIGSISVNNQVQTGNSVTEQLLNVTINNVATIVVGEATVDQPATNPCTGLSSPGGPPSTGPGDPGTTPTGTNPGGGTNPGTGGNDPGTTGTSTGSSTSTASSICPVGSTLMASSGLCEIVSGGTSGTGTKAVAVGSPNSGDIVGGQVITLAAARAKYKSICLKGAGPKYVVVGTQKADKMTVKNVRLRVLALGGNDTVTVKGGKGTCVDGGVGNDKITNLGTNAVSVYGGNGNDAVTIGSGKAYVSGGNGADTLKAGNGKVSLLGNNGNDKITAGNGADQLNGDAGNDIITAGTGVDRINGGAGTNVLTAKGTKAYLKATGHKSTGYLTKASKTRKYARTHGVKVKTLA